MADLQRNEGAVVPLAVTQSIWQQASAGVASLAQIPIGVLLNRKSFVYMKCQFFEQLTAAYPPVIFVAVVWVADELALGAMLSYSISDMLPSENCSSEFFQNSSWFLLWVRGMILVDTTVVLLLSNAVGPMLARTLGGDALAQWAQNAKTDMTTLYNHWTQKDWDGVNVVLTQLNKTVVWAILYRYPLHNKYLILIIVHYHRVIVFRFALPGLLLHCCRVLVSFSPTQLLSIFLVLIGTNESAAYTADIWMQVSNRICVGSSRFLLLPLVYVFYLKMSGYWRHLYDKIRDDNFLIGRTLQNAVRKVRYM